MPPGGKNLGLRTLFSVGGDDVLAGQRGCSVNLVEHSNFVRLNMDVRGRCQTDQRYYHKHYSQGQGESAEIRSRSIDEEAEDCGRDCRENEIQYCYDDPEHQILQTPAVLRDRGTNRLLWSDVIAAGAQLAPHDLPGRGQRQFRDEDDLPRRLIVRQTRTDKGANLRRETGACCDLGLGHDEGLDDLAPYRVGAADDCGDQHGRMLHQTILDIGRTDAITAAR